MNNSIERLRQKAIKVQTAQVKLDPQIHTTIRRQGIIDLVKKKLAEVERGDFAHRNQRSVRAFVKRAKAFLASEIEIPEKAASHLKEVAVEAPAEQKPEVAGRYTVQLVREAETPYEGLVGRSPQMVYEAIEQLHSLSLQPQEHFVMLAMDTKGKVIGSSVVHVGDINSSVVSMRSVFQRAVLMNATTIAVAHNHPSGDTTPSPADIQVTRRLVECGEIMGISVVDHIIVGDGEYCSLREANLVNFD